MYSNQILCAEGKAKKEDLDRIEQKFHVKIPADVREHCLAYNCLLYTSPSPRDS